MQVVFEHKPQNIINYIYSYFNIEKVLKGFIMNELAKDIAKNLLKDDPEIEVRVARGIEENRKGFGEMKLIDKQGKPVEKAQITLKLIRHEFHFGCNAFMTGQFKEAEENALYEQRFADLFNLAVVPFYWSDTEPEDGKLRFGKDSPFIYRRPPVDMVLDFCDKYHIIPKGHPLCWHMFLPKWAPLDKKGLAERIERHIAEIASCYGQRIKIWDVCNEAIKWYPLHIDRRMPERHVEFAFETASRYMPRSSTLIYNDYACWANNGDYTAMYMLGRHLKNLNVNLGALGLQFHLFARKIEELRHEAEIRLSPRHLLSCLDQYAKLQIPVNISEITIPAHKDLGNGAEFQKEVARRLYRLWFSHHAVDGIVWWNLVDDTAYVNPDNTTWNENEFKGGLINRDFSPKPAYDALRELIKKEWTTKTDLHYTVGGNNRFNGFYGDYEVTVTTDTEVFKKKLKLSRGSINIFNLELK